jgi:hypothetical protein
MSELSETRPFGRGRRIVGVPKPLGFTVRIQYGGALQPGDGLTADGRDIVLYVSSRLRFGGV